MAEAARASRPSLREHEKQLDRAASVLDLGTDISFREVLRIFARVISTFRLFKARIATKLGFITVELVFRLMVAPWPGKVVVDHVILGMPIGDASGFPAFLAPAVLLLDGMGPVEMMLWVFLLGAFMVTVFGFTTSRGAGRSPSGAPTGASAGSSGGATALTPQGLGTLAQGHDIATQTENQANLGSGLMAGILGFIDFRVHLRLSQSMNHFLRTRVAGKLRSLPMTTLDDLRIGDSVYRVLYDSTSANMLLHGIALGLYSGLLGVVITLYIMFTYFGAAPEVIVLGMLALPIVFLIELPFARMSRRRGQASRASGSSTTSNIEEGMSNVLAVQSLGGNERESQRLRRASAESFKRFRTEWFLVLTYRQAFSLALLLSQVLFFIVMAGRVIDGTFTAGDYFVLTYYFFVLSATFGAWGFMYTEWQRDIAGMRRVFFLMDLPAEKTRDGVELDRIKRGVEMKGVGLTYPDGRRALRNVDLEARIGEIVAFVGPTGAGKTSLAYTVPAFVQATEGTVKVDGVDLKDVAVESLRKQVSYVFQETQLFSDSILENIRYGNPAATEAQVERAARVAGAHDFIAALPDGYRTNLGTVTSKLSVGQKQRIAIARGILRDARIVILDEPTSALDPETEAYLVDALNEAAKDRLVIIIAHRLSTIANADRICFLEDGEVRESGTHEELMAMPDGRYREYVSLQAGSQA
ncbi:MAG: ABC transporter ATP-binding protein [Holophagales bacterium]|nr:ABC transporter ATP-binding protein [Holophagales bacterium]MYG32080.1 ABC transporter ATP-binding protein [Holophagales bacterium]MYI80504.1 ABC transporter ATP-binding protein [Holophagales bacterium]